MENIRGRTIRGLLSPIHSASITTPLSKIVGILKDQNAYEVFLDAGNKIGMVTTRDILRTSALTSAKAESLAIFVPKLSTRTTIEEAARLMTEYRIRALPIFEDNSFIGVIQAFSIINLMREQGFTKIKAKDIMTRNPVFLNRDDYASKARRVMIRRKIDHLPVLSGDELDGILTSSQIVFNMFQATETIDRDVMLSEQQRKLEFPVRYLIDNDPVTCEINDNLDLVFDEMVMQEATCSIVTFWKEVKGIITYRDYMKIIAKQLEIANVPIYIIGLPDDPFEAEMTKNKFMRIIKLLRKSFPFIEEAKAIIKTSSKGDKERRRYEVVVSIITPKKNFTYSKKGWDLPMIFDNLSKKMKKTLLQKSSKRIIIR